MRKRLMKKGLIKKGGSGIYLNANDKEAFEHFVTNSTARFLKTGSFGITYELTLNPGVQSKYLSLDASTYSQPVKKLILKTTFVYPLEVELEINRPDDGRKEKKKTTNIENFYEEVNIQTDTYLKTMQYLEPICPAIVYAAIVDWNDPFMGFITRYYSPQFVQQLNSYPGIKIGLIAMEIVSNAVILYDYMDAKAYYESFFPKALHTLIDFVIKTGYNHGDFHASNMIINPTIKNYFWGRSGKVSIIDFGFAEKLSQEMYKKIKNLYQQKKYVEILALLCDIPRKDGYNLNDFDGYTVMCLKSPPHLNDVRNYVVNKAWMNEQISILFSQREQSINHLVKTFTQKHLPLSNSAKNEMYNGVLFETTFIHGFDRILPLRKMDEQVKQILSNIGGYSRTKDFRLQVKACYMLMYLLNNNFNDGLDTRFAAMVYAGIFDGIEDKYVFRIAAPYVNERALKYTIERAIILEKVRFNNFLDYFSDEQLANVTQTQLSQILSTGLWQEKPERAVIALKIAANIPIINMSINYIDDIERFQELPFGEPLEDVTVEETNGVATNGIATNGIENNGDVSDGLPRPSFFPFKEPTFQKKKLTAGKARNTKRKLNKNTTRRKR